MTGWEGEGARKVNAGWANGVIESAEREVSVGSTVTVGEQTQ